MAKLLTPQQEVFLQGYLDPNSPTWGNATQSAIKAGYEQSYADNILSLMPKWLEATLKDNVLLDQALDNLSSFIGNTENTNIQWDATKFVLTTLGKNKFSTRNEISGPGGKDLFDPEKEEKAKEAINSYLNDNRRDISE